VTLVEPSDEGQERRSVDILPIQPTIYVTETYRFFMRAMLTDPLFQIRGNLVF